VYCRACGTEVQDTELFCSNCSESNGQGTQKPGVKYYWVPLLMIAGLCIISLVSIFRIPALLYVTFDSPLSSPHSLLDVCGAICLWALFLSGVYAGVIAFWLFRRTPKCLEALNRWFKMVFMLLAPGFVIAMIEHDEDDAPVMFRLVAFLVICYFYFKKSKTVHQIYGRNM
jgi:hypothetical protein